MLLRTEPFRELDRFFAAGGRTGSLPMDAYTEHDEYVLTFDLPGLTEEDIEVKVERKVLTVTAERAPSYGEQAKVQIAERPRGKVSRQVVLGETLDAERIAATYEAGVLTLRIPVVEREKPRTITVNGAQALAS